MSAPKVRPPGIRPFALGILACALAPVAGAGGMSSCRDVTAWPGAAVQAFILPYSAERPLSPDAQALVTMLQRHVLFTALKYSSIAVEELKGDPGDKDCTPERVVPNVMSRLRPEQVALFLGGRLFEQRGTVYLESWVSVPRASRDALPWRFDTGDDETIVARIPDDRITFAPRAIPVSILETLGQTLREMRRLHSKPDADSQYWELPSDPHTPVKFLVLGTSRDWMHVRLLQPDKEGWIPAYTLTSADNLKGAFPELYFVDGMIGYHQLARTGGSKHHAGDRSLAASLSASFARYLKFTTAQPESEVRALANILSGNAVLASTGAGPWSTETLRSAQTHYATAREIAPTSTTANTFYLACTAALCAKKECAQGGEQLHAEYLAAIARDPTSRELLDNLDVLYRAADRGRLSLGISGSALAEQRVRLQRAKGTMK